MDGKMLKPFCLAFVVLSILSATAAHAAPVIVPTDYPTVQDAVNAVQGTADPRVIINSNATLTETVTITQSVTIEAGTGYTPTIRGTSQYVPGRAIYFNPDSTSTQTLTLRNLTVLPRTGIGPGSGDSIIQISNAGTGATDILIEGLTLNDPENAGPYGINIRSSWYDGGSNNVTVQDTTMTLGGGPGYGVTAIFMGELGTLTVSNVTINMSGGDGEGFDMRGSLGSGISFTLEDSVFNMSAPLAPYSAEVGRLQDLVTATFQRNIFNLISNEQGSARGIITGWGSQDVIMDSNRFNGSGPNVGSAYQAYPFEGDTGSVIATNNVIFNVGAGFYFVPQSGTPGGVVNATLTNNTIDGSEGSGVYFGLQDGTTINATITNNLITNIGGYGFEGNIGTGATLNVTNSYNDFFNNALGATDGTVTIGSNTLYVDPLYVDRAGGNLHLQATSPVINMGDNGALSLPTTDADGNPRIVSGTVDMGAYEYVLEVITVSVDIKPGSCPNPLSLKSKGVQPVAVLGAEDLDVTTIDPATIRLSREGIEEEVAPLRWSYEDVATPFEGEPCECHYLDGDGYIDLTLKFSTQELVECLELEGVPGATIPLTLTGNIKEEYDGTPITGEDCVWVLN